MSENCSEFRMPDGEAINRYECMYCFNDNLRNDGEYLCLQCDTCICEHHCKLHYQKTKHKNFLRIQNDTNDVQFAFCDFNVSSESLIENPNPSEVAQVSAALVQDCPPNMRFRILEVDNSFGIRCTHVQNLINEQITSNAQANEKPVLKCASCDLNKNLWFCIQCGRISCGRQQPGAPNSGNGHGVAHGIESSHPLVLRLDSLCSSVQEVYCYQCDMPAHVPANIIDQILTKYGLQELMKRQSAEKSLAEAYNDDLNAAQDQSSVKTDPDGPELTNEDFSKVPVRKIRNMGNTCYANAVLNCILRGPLKRDVIYQHMQQCKKQFQLCCGCQLGRLACSPGQQNLHAVNLLMSLNSDFTLPGYAGHQQDAVEFFNIFMSRLKLPILKQQITRVCSQCNNPFGDSYTCNDSAVFLSPDEAFIQSQQTDFNVGSAIVNPTEGTSRCKQCDKDVVVTLKTEVREPFPPMLVLQLNRVRYDPRIQNIAKFNYGISNYNVVNVQGQQYDFYGGVVHVGKNYTSGHYISILRCSSQWVLANDQYVNWVSETRAREMLQQSYMLFYEKK